MSHNVEIFCEYEVKRLPLKPFHEDSIYMKENGSGK